MRKYLKIYIIIFSLVSIQNLFAKTSMSPGKYIRVLNSTIRQLDNADSKLRTLRLKGVTGSKLLTATKRFNKLNEEMKALVLLEGEQREAYSGKKRKQKSFDNAMLKASRELREVPGYDGRYPNIKDKNYKIAVKKLVQVSMILYKNYYKALKGSHSASIKLFKIIPLYASMATQYNDIYNGLSQEKKESCEKYLDRQKKKMIRKMRSIDKKIAELEIENPALKKEFDSALGRQKE